jgi:uncharacterized damage-inducible protein DinB
MKETISNYIKYNHWANERLTDWLRTLEPELLQAEVKSSFPGIALTLQHIKDSQHFWWDVITEQEIQNSDEPLKSESIDFVITELLSGSAKMIETYTTYSEEELVAKVSSPVMQSSRYDFILHVINHNSYHRGQIITMARFLGVLSGVPETDYEVYIWHQSV